MSQQSYPQYPQRAFSPLQRTDSPHTGAYPQVPHPQSPHIQGQRPQAEYPKGGTQPIYSPSGPPQYGSPGPSNIALPNQVFSSPYYGAQPNGGPPSHNFNTASPYSPHSPHTTYTPQYNSTTHQTAPPLQPTSQNEMAQHRGGTMGPPSRPNDKPTDINDLGDVLAGSGVDLREEEAAMFRFNSSDRQYGAHELNEAASSSPTPYPFSRENHYSPYVPGDRQSFYGAGFFNQPAAPYKSAETIAEDNKKRKIREKAEIKQYHLNDPFLLAGTLRRKMSAEVNRYHIKFDDSGLFLPKNPSEPPLRSTVHGPDGHNVTKYLYNQGVLQFDTTLVEILSLLSLATQERMRMLVEDAATLARGRRVGALGIAPTHVDSLVGGIENSQAADTLPTPGDSAVSPNSNPLKRSYSEMNKSSASASPTSNRPANPVTQALQQTMKQDRSDEEKRLAKRAERRAKNSAVEGGTLEGVGTPSASGDVAPNVDIKKSAKKGKAADNVSQAQQLNALNNTTQMALGGKKMPSWMSGASKGPSNPYLARPNANVKKENAPNTNGPGNSLPKSRVFGDFREDKDGGKGIQLRDLIMVLEQNVKGTEKRALQKAYARQGDFLNAK